MYFQLEDESSSVITFEQTGLIPVPDPLDPRPQNLQYEDDNFGGDSFFPANDAPAAPPTTNRRRAASDKNAANEENDEGDFILRREIDFGLRRNVARNNGGDSQRTRHSEGEAVTVAAGGSDSHSEEPVQQAVASADGSRRTGLPSSRRVLARQNQQLDTALAFPAVGDQLFSRRGGSAAELDAVSSTAAEAPTRQATVARQRLRQELLATTTFSPAAIAEEEPSARAASPSGRARSQFQRARSTVVAPPEAPLAAVLPRSGHSTHVEDGSSQQV